MLLTYFSGGTGEQALEYGEQSLAIARENNFTEQLAYTLHDITRAYGMVGDFQKGFAAQDEARELWRELNNMPMLADSLTSSGYINFEFGNFEQAREYAEEANNIAQSIGNQWGQAYSGTILGAMYMETGEFSKALRTMVEAERLAGEANFLGTKIIIPGLIAIANLYLGDLEVSREALHRALEDADDAVVFRARIGAAEAWWHHQNGDLAQANVLIQEASAGLELDSPDIFLSSLTQSIGLDIDLANKNHEIALQKADKYLTSMDEDGRRLFRPDLLLRKGLALQAMGETQAAWSIFVEAQQEAESLGSKRALLTVLAGMYPLALELGDDEEALSIQKQGVDVIEFMKGQIDDTALLEKFLQTPDVRVFSE
jgi:tetratricopeptide (TPR) repeat protein